jgi:hypothetical protein
MKQTSYEFYPVVRQGYRPDSTFSTGTPDLTDSGGTDVSLDITGKGEAGTTTKQAGVALSVYGPGEVTNLDTDQIARLEPEPDTTDFSPNYFPLVEFDSPQLPWLFSPQRADDQGRNRPWLCLVVVPTAELTFEPAGTGPCPALETAASQLPDAAESWAWAHAQLVGSDSPEAAFGSNSTATVSRLLCPRNLDPQTSYRACVVPTFEAGRRAGLGLDPEAASRALAWTDQESIRLPVYHSWEFTTAQEGDFEALAREIDPTQLGPDVGFRTIDASNPGPVDLKLPADAAADVGTVGIGGALMATGADPDTYDESMRSTLRDLLNRPAEVIEETEYDAVGPPLYGQWHAGVPELEPPSVDTEGYYYPTWFNTLNTDPRHRIVAGYGTQVVQAEQQRLMASAWEQFGDIQKANETLDRFQLSEGILARRHSQLATLSTGSLLGFSSPVHGHATGEGEATVHGKSAESDLPTALSSPAFRRISRPTGPMARRANVTVDTANLATRLETGRLPQLSDGLDFTVEQAVDTGSGSASGGSGVATPQPDGGNPERSGVQVRPGGADDLPTFEGDNLQRGDHQRPGQPTGQQGDQSRGESGAQQPDIERALTALDSLDEHAQTASRAVSELSGAVEGGDSAAIEELTETAPTVLDHAESIRRNTFDAVTRALGKVLAEPRPATLAPDFDRPGANGHLQSLHAGQRRLETALTDALDQLRADDSPAASDSLGRAADALADIEQTSADIRSALRPQMQAMTASAEFGASETLAAPSIGDASPVTPELPSTEQLRGDVLTELDPAVRLPEYASEAIGVPNLDQREDPVAEILAAPSFTTPTYELLADLDQEYFLPGVGDVPRESVGILQTNPQFVEAFMAGLNHEFARELRWRKYPTDRRGSYFRRFWDRRGSPESDTSNPEKMADIEPMHTWDQNDLGQNSPGDDSATVVLLLRSELLRRFPNTDIFAAKAVAEDGEDGTDRVPALPNTHVTRDDAGDDVKFHVFRGTLDPDITFFGFDLSPDEALYDPYHRPDRDEPDDHADEGWFFVLQEPPAETRFGMDVGTSEDVGTTPLGITTGDAATPEQTSESAFRASGAEHGWSALSWAHLTDGRPDDVTYVDVDGSRPGTEGWSVEAGSSHLTDGGPHQTYSEDDAAEWGYNSAHVARATWQLPVRISIHADDMMPEEPPDAGTDTDWRSVQFDTPAFSATLEGSQ